MFEVDLIALGGLVVAIVVAVMQILTWIRARKDREIAAAIKNSQAEDHHDIAAVDAAEKTIGIAERMLINLSNDNAALRTRVRELEADVSALKKAKEIQ